MPSQKALSAKLYADKRDELLANPGLSDDEKAWRLSSCQFGSGVWLHSVPAIKHFKCAPSVYRVMLQIRLGLTIALSENIHKCVCGLKPRTARETKAITTGRHWMTVCKLGHRALRHNKLRDVIVAMYRSCRIHVDVEVAGLYAQLTSYGEHKPADILEPASARGGDKPRALDIAITDPTSKSSLDTNSHTEALKAAHNRHVEKMGTFHRAEAAAGGVGLNFIKLPIVFESTGAMGEETQKWWQQMLKIEKENLNEGAISRRELGLEHTWTANNWSNFWLQRISMVLARHQAETVLQKIGASQPASESRSY